MPIPAKLMGFIEDADGEVNAIVHSCLQHRRKTSVLTYRWQLEYKNVRESKQANTQYDDRDNMQEFILVYHKISIDTIQKHCLIIPYEDNSHFVMEVVDQDLWAKAFSNV